VAFATKMKHLFFALRRRPVGVPFGDGRCIDQASFSALYVGLSPTVETGAANPKIPTRLRNMANLFSVSKYPQFALYLALIRGH
jgi:hypothetical protein